MECLGSAVMLNTIDNQKARTGNFKNLIESIMYNEQVVSEFICSDLRPFVEAD